MKKVQKILFYIIVLIIGMFIYNGQVYAETDCSKYACATCVYQWNKVKITYTISSDGKGTLDVSDPPNYDFSALGSQSPKPNIDGKISDPDVFKDISNNRLMCSDLYLVTLQNGSKIQSTKGTNGTKLVVDTAASTNNNLPIVADETNYNSCDFRDSNTGVTCTVQSNNGKLSNVECGTFKYNSNSDISGVDFSKQCSQIQLYLYCNNTQGYCTLSKDKQIGNAATGTGTEGGTIDNSDSYTCNYKGKVNGTNLTITKSTDKWEITANGTTEKYSIGNTGDHSFPSSNCEDIFKITKSGKVSYHIVEANTLHTDTTISTWCSGYGNEVEQFCHDGKCKISNPRCGSSLIDDDSSGNGLGCPWQLRAIIVFLKKIAFNTVQMIVPILLILMGTIDFVKAVASSDEKGNKEAISKFIKRCLAAIMVFFIGTIVSIVMNMFLRTDVGKQNDWKTCWESID